jgi:hypothetical protein
MTMALRQQSGSTRSRNALSAASSAGARIAPIKTFVSSVYFGTAVRGPRYRRGKARGGSAKGTTRRHRVEPGKDLGLEGEQIQGRIDRFRLGAGPRKRWASANLHWSIAMFFRTQIGPERRDVGDFGIGWLHERIQLNASSIQISAT